MINILLIGNRGYIGSALDQYLSSYDNYKVVNVDICWFSKPTTHTMVADFNTLNKQFLKQFDIVILLAGNSSVNMSKGNPLWTYKNNVENFIELISKLPPTTKFIYASSGSVYGNTITPWTETFVEFKPTNNYDLSKYFIDLYATRFDVQYYGLRFGTVNGRAPITRMDLVINAMVHSAKTTGIINLANANNYRPILSIVDLVRAVKNIIDTDADLRGIYNLCSFNDNMGNMARMVAQLTNASIHENDAIYISPYSFKMSNEKFERTFNFKFDQTIEDIIKSFDTGNSFEPTHRIDVIEYE